MRKSEGWADLDIQKAHSIITSFEENPCQQTMFKVISLSDHLRNHNVWGMDQMGQLTLPFLGRAGAHFRGYKPILVEIQSNKFVFDHQQLSIQFPGEPNRSERWLSVLIEKAGLGTQFPWTGNVVSIGNRWKPDFPNHQNHAVIEMFGDYYHHKGEDVKRITLLGKYGYRTLIVWEHVLTSEEYVVQTLRDFSCGKIKSGIVE